MKNTIIDSFKNYNLYSKKKYLFSDKYENKFCFIVFFLNILILQKFYKKFKKEKKKNKIILLLLSIYIADFISGLIHCYFIDRKNTTYIDEKSKKVIFNVRTGYSSGHHLFPSNWIDIEDKVIFLHNFILTIPLHILNYTTKNNNLIYLISYQLSFFGNTHKYAHEKNHNRYVPKIIKILQKLKLSVSEKDHSLHHRYINKNFTLLNGLSNRFTNKFIDVLDKITKKKHYEDMIDICEKYKKIYGNKIRIQFIGDIEGELDVYLENNKFTVINNDDL